MHSNRRRWFAIGVGVFALAVIAFLILFQWNWLRGPLSREISARIHRPVSITGDLEVHPWSLSPTATVNGLVIGNPAWAGTAPLATLPRLTVQVKVLPLLTGQVILPLVEADRPDVGLMVDASGRSNWVFNPNQPAKLPPIGHLIIENGAVRYNDVRRRIAFTGVVSTNELAIGSKRGIFHLLGGGSLAGTPFTVGVVGGPLVNVDPTHAYDFDAKVSSGPTHVTLVGHILHPFDLGILSGTFSARGSDLSDLYRLTGVALPSTPPYDLTAGFGRDKAIFTLRGLHGRMGDSDLEGDLKVDDTSGRPFLTAGLASRRLRLVDLGAFVGAVPKHIAGHTVSPAQTVMAAKLSAEHRMLPDSHLDVSRVRGMDARVTYKADSVEAGRLPIRTLSLKFGLDHGIMTIDPLDLILPQGRLAGTIRVDARAARPLESIDLRLTNGRLETLVGSGQANPPLAGGLYARARLSSGGDSVRAAAAGANGAVTLVIPKGEMRQAFAELMGIDATKGLLLLIEKNKGPTPIRCAVADFQARDGVLTAQRIVLDTGVVLVSGTGNIDLRQETVDLRLSGKPKKFRIVHLSAPITIKGSLVAPKVGVDIVKAAPQALISVAVGVFAAPLAAILPFVSPGLAKDADCAALVSAANDRSAPVKRR